MNDLHQSDQTNEITKAMIAAHREISHALKDSTNDHFRNSFASLTSVIDATKDAYLRHDCIVVQLPSHIGADGKSYLITQVSHVSGQWVRSFTPILSKDPNDPQKFGSGLTYARRYALAALSNLGQIDDDGNHASADVSKAESSKKALYNPDDPLTWVYPFEYPDGMQGYTLYELGTDGILAAGKSLAQWKAKAGASFPKEAQRYMDAMRDLLAKRGEKR